MSDGKRLIEEEFPLKEVSLDSVHEKNVRHGHLSTLHIWPARRPLAACRAAVAEALLPCPEDPDERRRLVKRIGGNIKQTVLKNSVKEETEGSLTRWLGTAPKAGKKAVQEFKVAAELRERTLDFFREEIRKAYGGRPPRVLDPFSGGGAIPLEAMRLGCETFAMDVNPVACFILKATLEYPQRLAGKTLPLPDFALKDKDFMKDFYEAHPKADPKKAGSLPGLQDRKATPEADLAWQVRAWGRHVLVEARKELGRFYPTRAEWEPLESGRPFEGKEPVFAPAATDGMPDMQLLNAGLSEEWLKDGMRPRWVEKPAAAYLWARTCRCPSCRAEIPLLKTRWLCKKDDKRVRLDMEPNADRTGVVFSVEENVPVSGGNARQRAERDKALGGGTMTRRGVTCPCCGATMTMEELRRNGKAGRLGMVPTAVVYEQTTAIGKRYRRPEPEEIECARLAGEELERVFRDIPFGIPEEPTPACGSFGASRAFTATLYGFSRWRDLFTPRQLLALGVFCRAVRNAMAECQKKKLPEEWTKAIGAYLAIAVDKLADYNSTLCTWHVSGEKIGHSFARFAIPITWDICELAPVNDVGSAFSAQLEWIVRFLDENSRPFGCPPPKVLNQSCMQPLPEKLDCIVTDPPYYDAIPYSDCMDFFYVWLRRTAAETVLDDGLFKDPLGPKWDKAAGDGELIDDASRHGGDKAASKQAYEDGMAQVFKRCADALVPDGRMVVVFANKKADAWETLVGAIIRSGFQVTASWPISTEMANRTRGIGSAALATSVWLVCRKRGFARPGWDGRVLDEMRTGIVDRLRSFWDAGVKGPDFIWAATGAALASYSAYPAVKKADSEGLLTVSEFLAEVRRIATEFVVGRVMKGAGEDGQDGGASGLDPVTSYYLLHRNDFGMGDAPAGPCILYATACGTTDGELSSVWNLIRTGKAAAPATAAEDDAGDEGSGSGGTFRLLKWSERKHTSLGVEGRAGREVPLIDRIHKLMQLWTEGNQTKVDRYVDASAIRRSDQFQRVVQALVELSEGEERAILESIFNHVQNRGAQTRRTEQGSLL